MNAISMTDPRLKPATAAEIEGAVRMVANAMRPPEGVDHGALLAAYHVALEGYPKWAIANAGRRFLRGEVPGQHKVFCPRPPEFSEAVRTEMAPLYRQIEREAVNQRARREMAECRPTVTKTPEAREKVAEMLAVFRAQNARETPPTGTARLDMALVEQVPDAPTTWARLKWEQVGGDRG